MKRYGIVFLIVLVTALIASPFLKLKVLNGVSFSREVYDKNEVLLRLTLSGDEKYRIFTRLEDIHPQFVKSVLLLEDQYFYYHFGINPVALVRALLSINEDTGRSGASTITMQLARIRFGLKTRTLKGKLFQMVRALQLELTHSKKEILEAYLNLVPYGGPIEGVGAASRIYFHRSPKDLSLSESLLLAVIPQSPSRRSLVQGGETLNPSLLSARERLLRRWMEQHPGDREHLVNLQLPLVSQKLKSLPFLAPHFSEYALRMSTSVKIKTTLDLPQQKILEDKVKSYVERQSHFGIQNATALIVNHEDMSVVAAVGSKDFHDESIQGQVNGLLARRSPGSALKPFVYALAFQQGLGHPKTLLKDTPTEFALYDPENFDKKFLGPISTQEALIHSRNIPALTLSNQLRRPDFYEFLKSSDMHLPRDADYYGLSLVLGGTEISPWELAQFYAMLANKGRWQPLKIFETQKLESRQQLTPEASIVTLYMLTHTPPLHTGYHKKWTTSVYPVAWKTGTSHSFRDAWTVGVVGPYVVVTWVGNFDNAPNPQLIGRDMAAPLFFQIIDSLPDQHLKNPNWLQVAGTELKKINVCKLSGHLPGKYCPHQELTWYHPGVSPIKTCDIHRPVLISKRTGKRTCGELSGETAIEIYEFWPSDLKNLFAKAGIRRQEPPEFEAQCDLFAEDSKGQAPQITSPGRNISYLKSLSSASENNLMSLQAVADGDAKELYWFVDKNFIGKTKTDQTLQYSPTVGEHLISVVDDRGRADHRTIQIEAVQ
ncbi:MAG: penicillin-binding protein 1C [Bdellovibrionales bacterium]|nr:penicillin-binding protein 1C [Bdellovibrionales bacterium]